MAANRHHLVADKQPSRVRWRTRFDLIDVDRSAIVVVNPDVHSKPKRSRLQGHTDFNRPRPADTAAAAAATTTTAAWTTRGGGGWSAA